MEDGGELGSAAEQDGLVAGGRLNKDSCCRRRGCACCAGFLLLAAIAGAGASQLAKTNKDVEAYISQGESEVTSDILHGEDYVTGVGESMMHPGDETSTTTTTSTVTPAPPYVTFVTAETRGDPLLKNVLGFTENFTDRVINIGTGHKWHNYKTKVSLLAEWLAKRAEQEAKKDPVKEGPEVIVFIDGSDVFWGGCDPDYFMQSYQDIVKGSGAPIVFSAEVVCGEQDCNSVPVVPSWANKLGGRDLNSGYWKKFAVGCKGTWNDKCAAKRDCGFWAPCSKPPAVKFLNSGFIMGPVQDLKTMVDWTLANYDKTSVWGDQSAFAVYWLEHKANVTLDYTGALALSLSDMSYKLMEVDSEAGVVRNTAFDHVQCLIHGNGRGIFFMKNILKKLTSKEFNDLRGF